MLRSRFVVILCVLAATGILCMLGIWQVQRLHWKEALIAEVEARRNGEPETFAALDERWSKTGDVDYRPVTVTGIFDHSGETYYYTTSSGTAGWDVFAPLKLDDGRFVFVDRGFVPMDLREPPTRAEGQVGGRVSVNGLARNPPLQKPNFFVPDNDPAKRNLYWKDRSAMVRAAGLDDRRVAEFFIDAGPAPNPGGWPKGGATIVDFPNSHLQYALTWFGLAAACLGVGTFYLLSSAGRGPAGGGKG